MTVRGANNFMTSTPWSLYRLQAISIKMRQVDEYWTNATKSFLKISQG